MNAATLWMVRSAQGVHYHTFYARGMVAIGWRHIAAAVCAGAARDVLAANYRAALPEAKAGSIRAVSHRFGVSSTRCKLATVC